MAGAGGGGTVTPPSLTSCTEYNHNDVNAPPCDDNNGISNWEIWSLAFSPDGRLLATAGDDGRVKIWNFDGHTLTASGHVLSTNGQTYVAFSPDGATLGGGIQRDAHRLQDLQLDVGAVRSRVYGAGPRCGGDRRQPAHRHDRRRQQKSMSTPSRAAGAPVSYTTRRLSAQPVAAGRIERHADRRGVGFNTGRAGIFQNTGPTIAPLSAFTVETSASVNVPRPPRSRPRARCWPMGDDSGKLQFWSNPVQQRKSDRYGADVRDGRQCERRRRALLVARRCIHRNRRRRARLRAGRRASTRIQRGASTARSSPPTIPPPSPSRPAAARSPSAR